MKTRRIALLLALAISLCAVPALAEPQNADAPAENAEQAAPESQDAVETGEQEAGVDGEAAGEAGEEEPPESVIEIPELSPAGPDQTGGDLAAFVEYVPDEVGFLSFKNLERRLRENNFQLRILEESVLTLEEIDYEETYEDLRLQLNELAGIQWQLVIYGGSGSDEYKQLDQAYDTIREQFEAIKDGELQKDNADIIRQLNNAEDQIVMAGETLYVTLAALDIQEQALQRSLTAMNRTVEELELRYQLGQISALQLSEAKAGRASLASGLETLRMTIRNYKLQMEMLVGAEQTGAITLGAVPEVTAENLADMDLEADLLTAKEKSWELYEAAMTLEDAREEFQDNYSYVNSESYNSRSALHAWNAAQFTYNDTVQSYELKFRTLYAQVQDYRQVLESARVSLASEQTAYKAAELKYQQGAISHNAFLDAGDALREAEEKVQTAANDLFSAYNSYCWAVQNGILN